MISNYASWLIWTDWFVEWRRKGFSDRKLEDQDYRHDNQLTIGYQTLCLLFRTTVDYVIVPLEPWTTLNCNWYQLGRLWWDKKWPEDFLHGMNNMNGPRLTNVKAKTRVIALEMTIEVSIDDVWLRRLNRSGKTLNYAKQSMTTKSYCKLMQSNGTSEIKHKVRCIVRND